MALKIDATRRRFNAFQFVSRADDALDLEKSNYAEYLKTGDETHLAFVAGMVPTRFLLNMEFSGREGASIKNEMMGGSDDDGKSKIALGNWSYRVVKVALKDIANPPDLPLEASLVMKKDELGYVHDDLIAQLDRFGVVTDIFTLYTSVVLTPAKRSAKN